MSCSVDSLLFKTNCRRSCLKNGMTGSLAVAVVCEGEAEVEEGLGTMVLGTSSIVTRKPVLLTFTRLPNNLTNRPPVLPRLAILPQTTILPQTATPSNDYTSEREEFRQEIARLNNIHVDTERAECDICYRSYQTSKMAMFTNGQT
jgi:hypothetical protein